MALQLLKLRLLFLASKRDSSFYVFYIENIMFINIYNKQYYCVKRNSLIVKLPNYFTLFQRMSLILKSITQQSIHSCWTKQGCTGNYQKVSGEQESWWLLRVSDRTQREGRGERWNQWEFEQQREWMVGSHQITGILQQLGSQVNDFLIKPPENTGCPTSHYSWLSLK